MKFALRWILPALVLSLLGGWVYYLLRPDAEAEIPPSEKVSDESLPAKNPVAFLEKCLKHYDRTVKGYRVIFHKQERIKGHLNKPEEILVYFREKPFSVYFEWLKNWQLARRVVYVEGENEGKMLVRAFIQIFNRKEDVDGANAKRSGRYTLRDFGLKKGAERTLDSWKKAQARGTLHVKYLGVYKVGGRPCYKFHRTGYDPPEEDGIADLTVYIDQKTLLQVGSVLKDENGKLIATYFFKKIRLNPKFDPDQFKPEALTR
jgi:outer membrane lipoprotein-sorting protein